MSWPINLFQTEMWHTSGTTSDACMIGVEKAWGGGGYCGVDNYHL